jgi:hypothetical protein
LKRLTLTASFVLAVAVPAGSAQALTHAEAVSYGRAYAHAVDKFGQRSAGCKLIGPNSTCAGQRTDARIRASIGVLHRMFAPPPRVVRVVRASGPPPSSNVAVVTSSSTSYSGGGCGGTTPYAGGGQCWAIPYGIVQCESGGRDVPNTTGSGANGYYQLMNGGGGSKADQDAAASRLWAGGAGASNWTCAG